MNNYIQPGNYLPVANNSGGPRASGDGILVGAKVAIYTTSVAASAVAEAAFTGVFRVPKLTGASTGGAQGVAAYWNNTERKFTAVASGNTLAGYFAETVGNDAAECLVKLTG